MPEETNRQHLVAALAGLAVVLTGAVFLTRFNAATIVLLRLIPSLAAMILVAAAASGCGAATIAIATRTIARLCGGSRGVVDPVVDPRVDPPVDPIDEFLVGTSVFGSLIAL